MRKGLYSGMRGLIIFLIILVMVSGCNTFFPTKNNWIPIEKNAVISFGEMFADYENIHRTISIPDTNVYVPIDGFIQGDLQNFTFQSDQNIVPVFDGNYLIDYSISFHGSKGKVYGFVIKINDIIQHDCYNQEIANGLVSSVGGNCLIDINAGDEIGLFAESESFPTADIDLVFSNVRAFGVEEASDFLDVSSGFDSNAETACVDSNVLLGNGSCTPLTGGVDTDTNDQTSGERNDAGDFLLDQNLNSNNLRDINFADGNLFWSRLNATETSVLEGFLLTRGLVREYEINNTGVLRNRYNGVASISTNFPPAPDTVPVVFSYALPDTSYTVQGTCGYGLALEFAEPTVYNIHVDFQLAPSTKLVTGFTGNVTYHVYNSITNVWLGSWDNLTVMNLALGIVETPVDIRTCDWWVARYYP